MGQQRLDIKSRLRGSRIVSMSLVAAVALFLPQSQPVARGLGLGVTNNLPGADQTSSGAAFLAGLLTGLPGSGDSEQATRASVRKGRVRSQDVNTHLLIGYWQTFVNDAAVVPLAQVSSQYDVINVAFGMPAPGTDANITLAIDPSIESTGQFFKDIVTLHLQGKKIVLSIGGADAPIKLDTERQVKKFVKSVAALVHQYGFDGIDIDLEGNSVKLADGDTDFRSPTTPAIVNLISALRTLKGMFGVSFIISFAPDTFSVQGGFSNYGGEQGSYLPVIYGTRDILSWVQTQDYNSGSMFGLDGNIYTGGTADFHVAMTEFLLKGFPVAGNPNQMFPPLAQNQVAFGVPASMQAASTTPPSFTSPPDVQNALNYLINGVSYPGRQYTLQTLGGYPGMLGLMTWSINWDVSNGSSLSNQIGPFLHGLTGSAFRKPVGPGNGR